MKNTGYQMIAFFVGIIMMILSFILWLENASSPTLFILGTVLVTGSLLIPYFISKRKKAKLKKIHRENMAAEFSKREINDIKEMIRTEFLVKAYRHSDLLIEIAGIEHKNYFVPWKSDGHVFHFPQLFDDKLRDEIKLWHISKFISGSLLRRFYVKNGAKKNLCPLDFFESFKEESNSDMAKFSCSALEIITHFATNMKEKKETGIDMQSAENFYLWDLTPERASNKILKIVAIIKHPEYTGKYSLLVFELTRIINPLLNYNMIEFILKVPKKQ